MKWADRAACKGTPWWLWDLTESHGKRPDPHPEAVAMCAACPVRQPCLDEAIGQGDDHAYRGGTTPDERRAMRPPPTVVDLPEGVGHASINAYNNHGCRCGPCRNAAADYWAGRCSA